MSATQTPERVRQSYAALFDRCHLAAHLSEQVTDFSTHAQGRGTAFHLFAKRVVETCLTEDSPSFDVELSKTLMREAIVDSGEVVPAEEYETLMALAWRFAAERSWDLATIVDLEEQYEAQVAGLIITGRPDLIRIEDDVAKIRDYKTAWAVPPEADIKSSFQGRWYALIVFKAYPQVDRVEVEFDHVRWGEDPVTAVYERRELADLEGFVATVLERIKLARERDEWKATPGSQCTICPAAHLCPIPKAERDEGSIESPEAAQAVAEWLVATEALTGKVKGALKAWINENEPIVVKDLIFEFRKQKDGQTVVDYGMLESALKHQNLAVDEYLKPRRGPTVFKAYKVKAEGD